MRAAQPRGAGPAVACGDLTLVDIAPSAANFEAVPG